MVETETYTIHLTAFIYQPVATPHQPRFAQQLPPGGSQGHFVPAGRQVGDPYSGRYKTWAHPIQPTIHREAYPIQQFAPTIWFPICSRICKKDCSRQSSLLFQFPLFNLSGFFIQPQIAVIPGGHNLPFFQRLPHAAARLLPVGAVGELARPNPGGKIRERIL